MLITTLISPVKPPVAAAQTEDPINIVDYKHLETPTDLIPVEREHEIKIEIGESRFEEQQRQEREKQEAARETKVAIRPVVRPVPTQNSPDTGGVRDLAHRLTVEAFGENQWPAMDKLIANESGYIPGRLNKSSLACGLAQSLPCTKLYPGMNKELIRQTKATVIVNNQTYWVLANPDPERELRWMLEYVRTSYGTPSNALHKWSSRNPHWY